MASCAEVAAVTVCPAASKIAHFRVTTWGSSSMQRMRAIFVAHLGPCGPAYSWHQYCFAIQGIVKPPDNISPDTYLDAPIESHAGQYLHALQSCWPELQPKRKAEALAPARLTIDNVLSRFLAYPEFRPSSFLGCSNLSACGCAHNTDGLGCTSLTFARTILRLAGLLRGSHLGA